MPDGQPYAPLAELFTGLGTTEPEVPDVTRQAPQDMLRVGEKGRQTFKQWRQAPPDQAEPVTSVFKGASEPAAQALSATDMDTFLAALRPQRDVAGDQQARFWLHRYADQAGDPDAAQFDIAKFAEAASRGALDGRTAAAWRKIAGADGVLDEEEGAALLGTMRHLADATEGVGPDLTVGRAGIVSKITPVRDGVQVAVSRRADAEDDLPVPPPGAVPASVLAERLPAGEHQIVAPGGSVVPVLKSDPVQAHRYRGWYPAIEGEDGLMRWAPARAQRVTSVRSNVALEAARSGEAEVVQGDHWALDPEDSVVFSVPDGQKAPAGSVKLKRAVRIAPELRRERLTEDQIDPELFQDVDKTPLNTHQWAVLPDAGPIRSRLTRSGHHSIAIDTNPGKILVFGIDPEDAQAAVAPVRGGEILVNEGRILKDGRLDPSQGLDVGPDGEYRLTVGGRQVGFTMSFADDGDLVTERVPTASRSQAVTKFRVSIPEGRDPAEFAAELESRGATGLAVYARAQAAEGWQNASDWLFSDGVETLSVRTAGYRPEAHNSIPVWVRSTDGLPDEPVSFAKQSTSGPIRDFGTFKLRQNSTDFGTILSGRFAWQDGTLVELPEGGEAEIVVSVRGGRAAVEVAADSPDVVPALEARDSLIAGGFPAELTVR